MLMIRLRRTGAKKDPHYRVVVADRTAGRDGAFLEILGHYHPRQRPAEIFFDIERIETWLGRGARMSDTVRNLYRRARSGPVEEMPEKLSSESDPIPSDTELEAAAEIEADDVSADAEGEPAAVLATDEDTAVEGGVDGEASVDESAADKVIEA